MLSYQILICTFLIAIELNSFYMFPSYIKAHVNNYYLEESFIRVIRLFWENNSENLKIWENVTI